MSELRVDRVVKSFAGIHALQDVSLTLQRGEFLGLIGPNGSGKTTLINCITGHYQIDSGSISFAGRRLDRLTPDEIVHTGVARTFQVTKVFRRMTVAENLMVPVTTLSGTRTKPAPHDELGVPERLDEVLRIVKLEHLRHQPAGALSGGQQRLLEFGMMMLSSPEIVLLDEPFSGVYPELRDRLERILRQLHKERAALLLVSHDMSTVFRLCQRVVVLDKGRVIADGAPEDVRAMAEVQEAYLGG